MIRLFLYHSDPEILTKMQREMAEYFRGVRHTFQITASLSYKGTLAYLQSQPVRDDIFFFDCGNQKEALQLAAALRERELYASWVYVGKNRGGAAADASAASVRFFAGSSTDGTPLFYFKAAGSLSPDPAEKNSIFLLSATGNG